MANKQIWFIFTYLALYSVSELKGISGEGCDDPLGAESRWLSDESFTASSFNSLANDPSRARLKSEQAWVPASSDLNPMMQIQLKSEANISGIAIQGHPTKGYWVKKLKVHYSIDAVNWQEDSSIYGGSIDQNSVVMINLTSTVLCRFVRIIPTEWNQQVAIRLEIYGCGQVSQSCGIRGHNVHERVRRIVGGEASIQGSWPWMATLELNRTQWCGATLIAPEWIITGAHCFNELYIESNPSKWEVILGEYEREKDEEFEQRIQLKEIYYHDKHDYYWPLRDTVPEYDIALIRLTRPAQYTEYVQPICLLNPAVRFKEGDECVITGWGKTNSSAKVHELFPREASVPLVSLEKCNSNKSYNGLITESMLCAGKDEGGVDACQFDSGGPLSCQEDGHWYQTGIVSFGFGCGEPHYYGVYADMHIITDWVKNILKNVD